MSARKSVFSIVINAPQEFVWNRLTCVGEVQPFYFNSVLDAELVPGGRLCYRTENGSVVFIEGDVIEVAAPHRFVHSLRFTDLDDEMSTVMFELTTTADGTRVTVTHEGPESTARTFARSRRGWRSILSSLKALIETGKLPLKSRVQYALMALMLPLMPKPKHATRS